MILDLRAIERTGKEKEDFFFEYSPDQAIVALPNAELKLPVNVAGSITLTGAHSAYVEGEVCFTLKGECTRCLDTAEEKIVAEFYEEISDDDPESYPLINDKIDLSKIVEDAIMMAMPVTLLCKEDCKGICPDCGVNLNRQQCQCKNK